MADATHKVRYFQDAAQTQGPYLIEFDSEDKALAFIESIGTGEIVAPIAESAPAAPAAQAPVSEGDTNPEGTQPVNPDNAPSA